MKLEVNYTRDFACCKECPYYFQEHDMGATIPICTRSEEFTILSNPDIIPNDCPINAIKVKPFDTSSIGKEIKCNCEVPDEVIKAIKYLDDYELYSPYQEAWQKVKEYYGIIVERR